MNKSEILEKITANRRVVTSGTPTLVDTVDSINQYTMTLYRQTRGNLARHTVSFVVVAEGDDEEAAYMLESGALEDDAVERFLTQRVNADEYLAYKVLSYDEDQRVAEAICYSDDNGTIAKRLYFIWRESGAGWQISPMTDHTPQVVPLEVLP